MLRLRCSTVNLNVWIFNQFRKKSLKIGGKDKRNSAFKSYLNIINI